MASRRSCRANSSSAWTQSGFAQDAEFTIGGIAASSSTQRRDERHFRRHDEPDAASAGTTQTLTIAHGHHVAEHRDQQLRQPLQHRRHDDVDAHVVQLVVARRKAPLLGDSTLQTIKNTLASIVGGSVGSGSTGTTLASIGITLKDDPADGTMVVDNTALNTALTNNPATVASLFNSTNGIAEQLNSSITTFTQTGGIIDTRNTALNADLKSITTQQTALADYTAQLTNQYQAQFTALNTLMATMNNNSQYLTALFGGTNSAGALATNKS